jgi:hypothetical protein
MILAPINDEDCLGQLTHIARELAPTTLVQMVAHRLSSPDAVVRWLQSLPQSDDDGHEGVRYIQCDVPQRVRLLPDDPNCVERATGAIMLLEVLDPRTPRALATIDRPLRHTGLVEYRAGQWSAVDLFPRRNFDWGNFGKDVLQGVHSYVGKPLLSFYGLGGAADQLGEAENKAIGRDGKKGGDDKKQPEKKSAPPTQQGKPDGGRQNPQPKPAGQSGQKLTLASLASVIGTGAKDTQPTKGGGAKDNGKEEANRAGAAAGSDAGNRPGQTADRNGGDPHNQGAQAQRWWWSR